MYEIAIQSQNCIFRSMLNLLEGMGSYIVKSLFSASILLHLFTLFLRNLSFKIDTLLYYVTHYTTIYIFP